MFAAVCKTVIEFFERATHLGQPVLTVFARADRAFAEAERVYKKRLQGAKAQAKTPAGQAPVATKQAIEDRPFPLPFIAVYVDPWQFDRSSFNPGRFVVSKDIKSGAAVTMRMPRPMQSSVTVELYASTDTEAHAILDQVELMFDAEEVALPIDWTEARWYRHPFNTLEHAKVLGRTMVKLEMGAGWANNSDLEEGDNAKLVRLTWSGKLKTRLPYKPQEARLVREVNFQVYDDTVDPPALIDEESGGAVED